MWGERKLLGWKRIDYISLDGLDVLRQELVQLDENLIRNEGTQLQRGEWFKRRKEIYEELYPETKQYVAGGKASQKAKTTNGVLPFVTDTSQKIGKSKSTVQRSIQIAENLTDKAKELIEGTPVEDKKTDLLKMAGMEQEDQEEVAEIIAKSHPPTCGVNPSQFYVEYVDATSRRRELIA